MYIVSVGLYTWMNISLFFSIGLLIVGCSGSVEILSLLLLSRLKSVLMYRKPVASAVCGVFFFLVVLVVERFFCVDYAYGPFEFLQTRENVCSHFLR